MTQSTFDPNWLLDQIQKLNPVQYKELLCRIKAPTQYLPTELTPQTTQAVELLRYAEHNPDFLQRLQEKLIDLRQLSPKSTTGENKAAGSLVYFLANRHHQERKLRAALTHWSQEASKPFVCVFYGADNQHDCFVERLLGHFFCTNFELNANLQQLNDLNNGNALRLEYLEGLDYLSTELDTCLNKARIAEKISREYERRPVLYFEIDNQQWHGSRQRNTITEFIRYWQQSNLLKQSKYPPLIFLGLQIMPTYAISWANRLPNWIKHQALMRCFLKLEKLDALAFQRDFQIPGVVLPQLDCIQYTDAIHWASSEDIKNLHPHLKLKTKAAALQLHIEKQLYPHKKPLPMRELSVALEQLCAQLANQVTP